MADESLNPPNLTLTDIAEDAATLPGWATFQYALNVLLPRYLREAEDLRQETMRLLRGV